MKKKVSSLLVFLFVAGDLAILNLALLLSYVFQNPSFLEVNPTNGIYLFIFTNIAWFFLLLITNPYSVSSATQLKVIGRSHFSFVFVHLLVVISLVLFLDKKYSPLQIFLIYLFFNPLVFLWRGLFFFLIKKLINRPLTSINFITVGEQAMAYGIRKNFRFHPEYGYRFLEYFNLNFDDNNSVFDTIQRFCINNEVKEIYYCSRDTNSEILRNLIDFGLNHFIVIKVVTDNSTLFQKGIQLDKYGQMPIINISAIALDDVGNQLVKRTLDIIFTVFISLLVLWWLLPLIAIIIKLDSKGPVLYKQTRSGKSNQPFECLKFRTMIVEKNAEFVQATQDDPRITRRENFCGKPALMNFLSLLMF